MRDKINAFVTKMQLQYGSGTRGWVDSLSDHATKRVELENFLPENEIREFLNGVCTELNSRHPSADPWVALLKDPGYPSGVGEDPGFASSSNGRDYLGCHLLINASVNKGQNPHIDGIGHPVCDMPNSLADCVEPLSVAVFMSRHQNTLFGDNFPIANHFEKVLRGSLSSEDFCEKVNNLFHEHRRRFAQRAPVPPVDIGTVNVFPKNLTVHCGAARGRHDKGLRKVIYFTICRKSKQLKYALDKMETAIWRSRPDLKREVLDSSIWIDGLFNVCAPSRLLPSCTCANNVHFLSFFFVSVYIARLRGSYLHVRVQTMCIFCHFFLSLCIFFFD